MLDRRDVVARLLAERGEALNLAKIYENPMAEAIKTMTMTGRGLGWLPANTVRAEIETGKLVVVDPEAAIDMRICIYRNMDKVRARVERLWSYLKDRTDAASPAQP